MHKGKFARPGAIVGMLAAGACLASCGAAGHRESRLSAAETSVSGHAVTSIVARVGRTPISYSSYRHWMIVGAATVALPRSRGSLPTPISYDPPGFTACISRLRAGDTGSAGNELKKRCEQQYRRIQIRILSFLIEGYWVREQASAQHVTVSPTEVHDQFEAERRAYSPASFRRLQMASHQTVPDFEFAVETRMLATRLLRLFTATHPGGPAGRAAATLNQQIRSTWSPRTTCRPDYVIFDCGRHAA